MLKNINEKCTQDQLAVIEAGLGRTSMIFGDGHVVGSLVQQENCEACKSMPITDGQWFLLRKANGQQVWVCAVCGSFLVASNSPFCVVIKTGPMHQDLLMVKVVVPGHTDLATIHMFKHGQVLARKD
eukprot:9326571-Karenia_brevis.AAC.1